MGMKPVESKSSLGIYLYTCRTLNYTWRHAIGELVDNAVDSYLENKGDFPNGIDIRISYNKSDKTLIIQDNAYGMDEEAIEGAIQISRSNGKYGYWEGGIGRYGLGMKKSCTFLGDNWEVVTLRKGASTKYTVGIDVMKLYKNNASEVIIKDSPSKGKHGTRITIHLRKTMRGTAESSVIESLAEMYRFYLEDGQVRIYWNDEQLEFSQPETRTTTTNTKEEGKIRETWWSTLELDVKGTTVKGEVYILQKMSNARSGIQLFHSGRMIIGGSGSPNNNWRPKELVHGLEGYIARRFCCILHLDALGVNHQKDGFTWDLFDQDDLIAAMNKNPLIQSYIKESKKQVGRDKEDDEVTTEETVKNISDRLDSESVNLTTEKERATADLSPTELTLEMLEEMIKGSEFIKETGKKPRVSVYTMENPYGPIMTSMVSGQEDGVDLVRLFINESHAYFEAAIITEPEKELWIEFLHALSLTEHTLSNVEKLDFNKIISTLGSYLAAYRSSED